MTYTNNLIQKKLPKNGGKKCHSGRIGDLRGYMRTKNENGFSLIELLLVVVIIGVVAALAVPSLRRAARAAENGTTFATMRTISSQQVAFFSQNSRFARVTELNAALSNSIGTTVGDRVVRDVYVIENNPLVPTDAELRESYTITATRAAPDDVVYVYELTQTGEIKQILP